jgi:hypothetical protein
MVIPPKGFSTEVLPLQGGQGWIVIPPPGGKAATTVLPLPGAAPAPFGAALPQPGQPQP